jgi:hypothetical protein
VKAQIIMDGKAIALSVERLAYEAFDEGKFFKLWHSGGTGPRTPTTAAIKKAFVDLGKKLGFSTAASPHLALGADDKAWLWDLLWYKMDGEKYTTRLPLILEIELNPPTKDVVDEDFPKLVVGRVDVRVWLANAGNSDARARIERMQKQIHCFPGSLPGDTYVFILFEWPKKLVVETYVVPER